MRLLLFLLVFLIIWLIFLETKKGKITYLFLTIYRILTLSVFHNHTMQIWKSTSFRAITTQYFKIIPGLNCIQQLCQTGSSGISPFLIVFTSFLNNSSLIFLQTAVLYRKSSNAHFLQPYSYLGTI